MTFIKRGGKTTTQINDKILNAIKPPKVEFNFAEWDSYIPGKEFKSSHCDMQFDECLIENIPKVIFNGTLIKGNESKVICSCSNCQSILIETYKKLTKEKK